MKLGIVVVACLLGCVFAQDLAIFSNRDYVPKGWTKGQRSDAHDVMIVRLFTKQQNLEKLEKLFLDVSTPGNPEYGKHWSIDAINDLVATKPEEMEQVVAWLKDAGVQEVDITVYKDSLKITTTVKVVERLFNTEIYDFARTSPKGTYTVTRQWGISMVPAHIKEIVEIVTGVDTFPAYKAKSIPTRPAVPGELASAGYVVPSVIRRVYNIPAKQTTNAKSSVGLIEFEDDNSYNKQDLAYFEKEMGVLSTKVTKIVGPYNGETPDAESTLDVQYATAIADGTTVWFWTVTGWLLDFSQAFNNAKDVPLVISMSWGWTSSDQCQIINCNGMSNEEYVTRTNTEWKKIGARGVSAFAASGDQGAPGDGNAYCSNSQAPLSSIFPGASPYVTSVGATMLVTDSTAKTASNATAEPPICKTYHCATTNKEAVCSYPTALITTGGGFSYYSKRPSWQATQVEDYLKSGVALPPSQYFHAENRGFPDTAGLGHNYLIRLGGSWEIVDGTSCSSPIWAAMATLINDERLNAGKPPLGFVAPMLYDIYAKDPSAFNSLPKGNNKCTESCCSQYGYEAGAKWDPDTGLGSPDYAKILQHAMTY